MGRWHLPLLLGLTALGACAADLARYYGGPGHLEYGDYGYIQAAS